MVSKRSGSSYRILWILAVPYENPRAWTAQPGHSTLASFTVVITS